MVQRRQDEVEADMPQMLVSTDKTVQASNEREIQDRAKEDDTPLAELESILGAHLHADDVALLAGVKQTPTSDSTEGESLWEC